jgi:hypothetical protein
MLVESRLRVQFMDSVMTTDDENNTFSRRSSKIHHDSIRSKVSCTEEKVKEPSPSSGVTLKSSLSIGYRYCSIAVDHSLVLMVRCEDFTRG